MQCHFYYTEFLIGLNWLKFNQDCLRYPVWVCLLLIFQEYCCIVEDSPDESIPSTLFHERLMICVIFLLVIHLAWQKKNEIADNERCYQWKCNFFSVLLNSRYICQEDNLRKEFHQFDLIKITCSYAGMNFAALLCSLDYSQGEGWYAMEVGVKMCACVCVCVCVDGGGGGWGVWIRGGGVEIKSNSTNLLFIRFFILFYQRKQYKNPTTLSTPTEYYFCNCFLIFFLTLSPFSILFIREFLKIIY